MRARIREEASLAEPATQGWFPSLSAAALAMSFMLVSLAIIMGGQPADEMGVVSLAAADQEIHVFMTNGAEGAELKWRNGPEGSRYLVLRGKSLDRSEVVAEVCGHQWLLPASSAQLQTYRVVRISEQC